MLQKAIDSGAALRKFEEIVRAQRGDPRALTDPSRLPRARHTTALESPHDGYVTRIDSEAVGLAAVALGAGRARVDSVIQPGVGFVLRKKVGDAVRKGEPLVEVHYDEPSKLEEAKSRLLTAYRFGDQAIRPESLILERIE
jgi:pyrimidine-nucleoside phosphorylase